MKNEELSWKLKNFCFEGFCFLSPLPVQPGMTRWVCCLYMNKQLLLHV